MDHLYSDQSINLSCISSLWAQELVLVVFPDIVSARQTMGLVFHLGFQTPYVKCHSLYTLMVPGFLHVVLNVLEINLGITSWSNEIWVSLGWVGLGWVVSLKPCIKFRIASSDLVEIMCNLPVTMYRVTMLHRWCKSTVILAKDEFITA